MLTAEDYRQSIRDGRASYLEGRRIEDPVTHPLLRVSVDWVASTYEQTCSADPGARNPIFDQPATPAELDEQMNFLIEADVTAASTAGCMALGNVAAALGRGGARLPRSARAVPPAVSRGRPPCCRGGRGRWRAARGAPHEGRHRPAGREAPRPRRGGRARAVRRAVRRGAGGGRRPGDRVRGAGRHRRDSRSSASPPPHAPRTRGTSRSAARGASPTAPCSSTRCSCPGIGCSSTARWRTRPRSPTRWARGSAPAPPRPWPTRRS